MCSSDLACVDVNVLEIEAVEVLDRHPQMRQVVGDVCQEACAVHSNGRPVSWNFSSVSVKEAP